MIKDTFKATNLETDSAVIAVIKDESPKTPYDDDTPRQAPSTPAL